MPSVRQSFRSMHDPERSEPHKSLRIRGSTCNMQTVACLRRFLQGARAASCAYAVVRLECHLTEPDVIAAMRREVATWGHCIAVVVVVGGDASAACLAIAGEASIGVVDSLFANASDEYDAALAESLGLRVGVPLFKAAVTHYVTIMDENGVASTTIPLVLDAPPSFEAIPAAPSSAVDIVCVGGGSNADNWEPSEEGGDDGAEYSGQRTPEPQHVRFPCDDGDSDGGSSASPQFRRIAPQLPDAPLADDYEDSTSSSEGEGDDGQPEANGANGASGPKSQPEDSDDSSDGASDGMPPLVGEDGAEEIFLRPMHTPSLSPTRAEKRKSRSYAWLRQQWGGETPAP